MLSPCPIENSGVDEIFIKRPFRVIRLEREKRRGDNAVAALFDLPGQKTISLSAAFSLFSSGLQTLHCLPCRVPGMFPAIQHFPRKFPAKPLSTAFPS